MVHINFALDNSFISESIKFDEMRFIVQFFHESFLWLTGKFREEFKAAFSCCIFGIRSHHDERFNRGRASTESRKSLTTQISNFDNVSKLSEHVVLTNINTIPSNGTASITHC